MYPSIGLVKAEVVQYFIKMSDLLLKYAGHRPLTLIRYPDGVLNYRFYKKDKPKWAPDWIKSVRMSGTDDNDYVVANNQASLAWLGNLAALELHPMQHRIGQDQTPDQWVIDLDPDEKLSFDRVIEVALELKDFLDSYGYHPLIKTSGGMGLHIVMPLEPIYDYELVMKSIKSLMRTFIKEINPSCTLHVHKDKRKGKILLDIYRNHRGNTTVSPYSLRGKVGAPISTPIRWEQLDSLSSAQAYNIGNIFEYIAEYGDIWADWDDHIAPLHDQSMQVDVRLSEADDALSTYRKKRNFKWTKEPKGSIGKGPNNRFVIQLHNSSNLHYDLRLEMNGVLRSWAIPKGLPVRSGVKRLAIQTEDHPIAYLNYEGVIPKGQYGAGEMWIFDQGKYEIIELTEKKIKIKLLGEFFSQIYQLINKDNRQWLITCEGDYNRQLIDEVLSPMLASSAEQLPVSSDMLYELKWDGIRALIYIDSGTVRIISRNGNDLTTQFPELVDLNSSIDIESGIFDGEIVCLDEVGRPLFNKVISRMHTKGVEKIRRSSVSNPAYFYAFDLIYMDGKDIRTLPLYKRRAWLTMSIGKQAAYRISQAMQDGEALAHAARDAGLEGVMVKEISSMYYSDHRSKAWLKVKFRNDDECIIIGYTTRQGDRMGSFGALHLAKKIDDKWLYFGKVGSGFSQETLKDVFAQLKNLEVKEKYIDDVIDEAQCSVWVEPKLQCKIKYASMTNNGTYREPVFLGLL